jgi:hypothetical protein
MRLGTPWGLATNGRQAVAATITKEAVTTLGRSHGISGFVGMSRSSHRRTTTIDDGKGGEFMTRGEPPTKKICHCPEFQPCSVSRHGIHCEHVRSRCFCICDLGAECQCTETGRRGRGTWFHDARQSGNPLKLARPPLLPAPVRGHLPSATSIVD